MRRGWPFQHGGVPNLLGPCSAALDANRLGVVESFLTSGATAFAGLGAAFVGDLRQFVCREINDVVLRWGGRYIGMQTGELRRNPNECCKEHGLQAPGREHAANREKAGLCLAREARL